MTTRAQQPASSADIARLREHVDRLVAIADKAFSQQIRFESDDHLAFMALNFAAKQTEHARSVLVLKDQMDAVLIARSMFEGLSQLLWATQLPRERPLRWRTFAFVRDWRTMRKQEQGGIDVTPERRAYIENGLKEYGDLFLSGKARTARDHGRTLPHDPYTLNWYGEKEKEVFSAVGGQLAYDELYGPFSEWHHWRVGGFGPLLKFDEQPGRFRMTPQNPHFTASALASTFQCLWQTLRVLEQVVPETSVTDLDRVRTEFLASCGYASSPRAII